MAVERGPWRGIIQRYERWLPIKTGMKVVTLHEGNTPLIESVGLSRRLGFKVFLKYEGANPTGSFKDRGMTVAVSRAQELGGAILCASTGNTSASAAAYGAKAGIPCYVILPKGGVALGKLAQAMIAGARILAIRGNFDQALALARQLAKRMSITLVNSVNPDRIEGQKTAAFEICDTLGARAPDYHLMPVGNAGNITAYWKGYKEYYSTRNADRLPRMVGLEAQGAAPIVHGRVIAKPRTLATAIRIGNPASWHQAERARDESGGIIATVSDREILYGYRWLASEEGLFSEPASAASVAGLLSLNRKGYFRKQGRRGKIAVLVLTGHGLKDPETALSEIRKPPVIAADLDSIQRRIRLPAA